MGNLEKLITARDKCAEVYHDLATDDKPDDGNLSAINNAILNINNAIKKVED